MSKNKLSVRSRLADFTDCACMFVVGPCLTSMPNYLPSFAGCGEPRIDANSGGNGGGGNSGGGKKDLALKAYLMGDQFVIAFQEKVGGCLRVPSCSIEVVGVTCNGIGVASRAMTSRTYDHELCSPSKAHQRVLYGASLHSCIAARKSDMREPHCGI